MALPRSCLFHCFPCDSDCLHEGVWHRGNVAPNASRSKRMGNWGRLLRRSGETPGRQAGGNRVENDFQTNGVLVDEACCVFLERNGFYVILSIGGPRRDCTTGCAPPRGARRPSTGCSARPGAAPARGASVKRRRASARRPAGSQCLAGIGGTPSRRCSCCSAGFSPAENGARRGRGGLEKPLAGVHGV